MRSKIMLAIGMLLVLGVMYQPEAMAQKVEQPGGPTENKMYTKSDLKATVGATLNNTTEGKTYVGGYATNIGPGNYAGARTLAVTATTNGKTTTIKKVKIPALKTNSNFFIEGVAPSDVNAQTVYKAIISSSPGDPDKSNDTASQVGSREGKP